MTQKKIMAPSTNLCSPKNSGLVRASFLGVYESKKKIPKAKAYQSNNPYEAGMEAKIYRAQRLFVT